MKLHKKFPNIVYFDDTKPQARGFFDPDSKWEDVLEAKLLYGKNSLLRNRTSEPIEPGEAPY